jgi:hypothetical protein
MSENDRPDSAEMLPAEQQQLDSNDIARKRVLEYKEDLLKCEHANNTEAEADAVDRSAQIIEQWDKVKDPSARQALLEGVGREMMAVHEAPPERLIVKDMPHDVLGVTKDEDFETDLNEWQLAEDNPKDALETYLHEYRHAEQYYEIQRSHGAAIESVNPERSSAVEYNLGPDHYVHPEDDQRVYEQQLVEQDAEAFGTKTAEEILERGPDHLRLEHPDPQVAGDSEGKVEQRLSPENNEKP